MGYALGWYRTIWEKHLPCQDAQQQGAALGATYVTSVSSQPYTCPGIPRPVHAMSGSFGPGLHAIPVPDTSQASLTTISNFTSLMRIQSESMTAMQRQMDTMLRTVRPQHLLTMSVSAPPVSANAVAQGFDETLVGYVRGGDSAPPPAQRNQTLLLAFRLGASDNTA